MNKIDIKNRKEFRVWDFFDAKRGKSLQLQKINEWEIPVIAAAWYNQWIAWYYDVVAEYENRITVSCNWVWCWSTFYHNYPFAINWDAIVLLEKIIISDYSKKFITSVLHKLLSNKYSYEEKCSWDKAKQEIILLPTDNFWNPDREYMENCMKDLEEKCKKELELLKKWRESKKGKIDTNLWKEFKVGELLQMQHQIELSPIDAFNNNMPNDITYPFYGQSSENNGIIDFYYLGENLLNNKDSDHCIMIHSNTHLAYHVNTPFYLKDGHGATTIFTNDNLNKFSVLFLIAVLNKTMDRLFDYDIKATKEKLKNLIVKLPVDSEWNPNRDFMESYMKNLMEKNREKLKCLN